MTNIHAIGSRLRDKVVFLSASVPNQERAKECQESGASASSDRYQGFEIDQAVISFARAIFCESGRLVFGGHPSISPLVAMVAGEYRQPLGSETWGERDRPPVIIYQSRAFEGHAPEQTLLMFKLGVAEIRWTAAVDGEGFEPGQDVLSAPCPRSTEAMRRKMIEETGPVAMVCVGGMAGVRNEVSMFVRHYPDRPIYALRRTGGAAASLNTADAPSLRFIDDEVMDALPAPPGPVQDSDLSDTGIQSVPYPLIAQTIVDEIAERPLPTSPL